MKFTKHRKAFSMLTAIFVIVIMATVGVMVMSLSGKMVKTTTAQFQREQAMLLAKSYTEYAIMAVMSNDRNGTGKCLQTINSDDVIRAENNGGFEVRVQIHYLSNNSGELASCPPARVLSDTVTTVESPLNIIVDVYVKYKDFDHHTITSTGSMLSVPYITYHKRTLQKI